MTSIRMEGRVKFYNIDKGFGFVRNPVAPAPGEKNDIFVHAEDLPPGLTLNPGDLVAFATVQTRRGMQAKEVELLKRADPKQLSERRSDHEAAAV